MTKQLPNVITPQPISLVVSLLLVTLPVPALAQHAQITTPALVSLEAEPLTAFGPVSTAPPDPLSGATTSATIGVNFTASTLFLNNFFIPPDTMGAIGLEHIVELINGRFSVYRKTDGLLTQSSSLNQFWTSAGVSFGGFTFDPRIVFDPFAERWFAASVHNSNNDNDFLIAVSQSSDPTAGWAGFAIDSDSSNLRWADYPTLGFNRDGVYLAANMFPIPGRGAGAILTTLVVVPKADLLSDIPTVANATIFEGNATSQTGFTVQPVVDLDDTGLPAAFLSSFNTAAGAFKRSNIVGDIAFPALDTATGFIAVTPFGGRFSAEQPGPNPNLEIANGSIFHGNVVLQNGTFWGVQTVNSDGRAALRWFQIDAETNLLLQEGLIADQELEFFYGSIAVNDFADVVIGFSGSGESQFVSSQAVVGHTVGGLTTFGVPLLLQPGAAVYFQDFGAGRNRWGDYSATVVDPVDPFAFWTFQEFVSAPNIWSTQITQLIVARDVQIDIRPRGQANRIDPLSPKRIRVAILTSDTFDAAIVQPSTVRFGATGTEAPPVGLARLEDVDGDGDTDLVLRFSIQATGIQCGHTIARATGRLFSGQSFRGSDFIRTIRCE